MVFPVVGGTQDTAAYEISNSLRFNDGDSAYMHLTTGSSGNRRTFTFSCWYKRASITTGSTQSLLVGSSCESFIDIGSNDKLIVAMQDSGGSPSVTTNQVFRDVGAWYHICIAVDTTQGTDTNRIKIYINGTIIPVADLTVTAWPSSNEQATFNDGNKHYLGANCSPGQYLDGYLAEVCLIDGQALTPTSFGEFDEDSPTIFKPIDVSGLTFGDEGWYLDFEDSDNLGDDESGNTNDFTEVNLAATDQATDTPTNNFCTMNPLDNYGASSTFSEGNCKVAIGTNDRTNTATMGLSAGKWYFECKYTPGSQVYNMIGIINYPAGSINSTTSGYLGIDAVGNWYYEIGGGGTSTSNELRASENNSATNVAPYPAAGSASTEIASGDIIQVAIDLDNNKIWWGKNNSGYFGTDGYNGVPADGTNGYTIAAPSTINGGAHFPAAGRSDSGGVTWEFNFGGCSAFTVSSGNSDGNGYGNFEYAVPSGFLAICTKNLGSDGG